MALFSLSKFQYTSDSLHLLTGQNIQTHCFNSPTASTPYRIKAQSASSLSQLCKLVIIAVHTWDNIPEFPGCWTVLLATIDYIQHHHRPWQSSTSNPSLLHISLQVHNSYRPNSLTLSFSLGALSAHNAGDRVLPICIYLVSLV